MRRSRLLGALAASAAAVFALAGCSLIPVALSPAQSPASAAPKVGECWNTSKANADNWADWEGADAVKCTQSHVLYTYEVTKITSSATSWAAAGSSGTLSNDIQVKAENACDLSRLVPKLKWNQELVNGFFFVPTQAQWKAGARWVRCDVGVLGYGTTLDNEVFSPLPTKISDFVSSVSSQPERYAFCIDSAVPVSESGPLDDPDARITDCRQDPQWALAGHGDMPEIAGAPFPQEPTANKEAGAICSKYVQNANETWIAYLPTQTDWTTSNDRDVECWIGQKSNTGTGSGGVA